ncbi:Lrp/AsnC ligand binding domain-containing protein [Candidatus Bathyarchaeota archaeon]|nr:Lrp/AsnC ligand binding domain-containing protein [Candidatus Bathyarchaeota archaeon]MBS7613229.1 Lrp/AsnC ligand binding domain-containing protein [Candidatus Bathyarchaeota archaeon]
MSIALVLINTETGVEEKVLEKLKSIKNVKEAFIVYGVYDIIVKVEADDLEELRDVISTRIRRVEGVRSTVTLIVIS